MLLKDRISISSERVYTDEGFLVVPAKIARSGIQHYLAAEMNVTDRDPKDIIKVYRPPEEVFSKDSLDSFSNRTVTDDHPPKLIDSKNFKKYVAGHSGPEVTQNGIYAETTLYITSDSAVKSVEEGKVEVSNGYTSDIEWVAGKIPETGESYDCIQRNIRGNHIALVAQGRCGPSCKISDKLPNLEENTMATVVISGISYEVADSALAQAITKQGVEVSDAKNELEKEKEDNLEFKKKKDAEEKAKEKEDQKEKDSMKAKMDHAIAASPTPEQIDLLVDNRTAVRDAAVKLSPDYDWKGKDCETVRKEIVLKLNPDLSLTDESAEYIKGRFDMMSAPNSISRTSIDAGLLSGGQSNGTVKLSMSDQARVNKATRDQARFDKKGSV